MTAKLPDSHKSSTETTAELAEPGFGWTQYAEKINGRFAMVGFVSLLALNLWTGQDFFSWLGLR